MSTASLWVSLELLTGATRQPEPGIKFHPAEGYWPWYFCPHREVVAWISESWDPDSLPTASCHLFASTAPLQSHLHVAVTGKAGWYHPAAH